jgi:uncharacterized protein involved in exopolysaccharide biosynthesis
VNVAPRAASPFEREGRDAFGLWAFTRMLYRRGPLILAIGAVFASLAFAAVMLTKPQYRAAALVMVDPRQERVLSAQEDVTAPLPPDSALVDSEIEIIRSPLLMTKLSAALALAEDPEWNARLRPPSFLSEVADPVRAALRPPRPRAEGAKADDVVDAVADAVQVRRRGLSYVIEIEAEAGRPERAAELANTLADLYLQAQADALSDVARRANS